MASEHQPAGEAQHTTGTEAPKAFPPFDPSTYPSTILWLVVSFGLIYLMMARYALPRVNSILKTRSRTIHDDIAAANRMRDEARAASAAYDKTVKEARDRGQQLAAETRNAVKLEQENKRQALELELNGKLAAAERSIAETRANAMANVGQIATETANAIVEHFTGRGADEQALAKALVEAQGRPA